MASETELREWRKFRAQSQRRLRPEAQFGFFGTTVLIGIRLLVDDRFPIWLLLIGLGNDAMRYLLLLVFVPPFVLGLAGLLFTSNNLDRMRQIRGSKSGATTRAQVVVEKWVDESADAYWISLTDEDIRTLGNHRLNLPAEVWSRYEPGDPIEVVYLPGDPSPYHREDFYAEDGIFLFDTALLVVEAAFVLFPLLGAGLTLWTLRRSGAQKQRAGAT